MVELWGQTFDGQDVHQVTLSNGDLTAKLITRGASLRDLRLLGYEAPLVLGLNSVADYEVHSPYLGATVGRFANRISGGKFTLDGVDYQLDQNDGENCLHGGSAGFSERLWEIETQNENSATFKLVSPDGDMGFPGNVTARCTYMIDDNNGLHVNISATTDAPTICALAHHSYFNLEDGGAGAIGDHILWIDADNYLAVDEKLIPLVMDEREPTILNFDFRLPRKIAGYEFAVDYAGHDIPPLDHNFCFKNPHKKFREVASLESQASGVVMTIETDQPGLQVYCGQGLDVRVEGLDGISYKAFSGIALETQIWPDAPNRNDFPTAVLRPGETLEQKTVYRFRMKS